MFSRKKQLHEADPATLSMEALLLLQAALIAKTVLTTRELQKRYETLATLSGEIDTDGKNTAELAKEAKRMNGICLLVENVLAQQIGKAPKP